MALLFPKKPALAVDWDGTCVELVYPKQGDWLPGAVDALRYLQKHYQVYIWSSRIAPVQYERWDLPLPAEQVEREIAYIKTMLRDANLKRVKVWTHSFKLPAVAYIDDKGFRFEGDWDAVLSFLSTL